MIDLTQAQGSPGGTVTAVQNNFVRGIGSSMAAGLVGLSRWLDLWTIYALIVGLIDQRPPDERMRWGLLLQPAIIQGFTEENPSDTVVPNQESVWHPLRPWQRATVDGFVLREPPEILEVKAVAFDQIGDFGPSGSDRYPAEYYAQIQWQLDVHGLKRGHLAALIAGNELRTYVIDRDDEVIEFLRDRGEWLWCKHILAGVPPPMGTTEGAQAYLKSHFPRHREPLRAASEEEIRWLQEYSGVRQKQKPLEKRREELEAMLKQACGDAEGLAWEQKLKFTWRKSKDTTEVNWENLAEKLLDGFAADEKAALIEEHTEIRHGVRRVHFTDKEESA